LCSIFIEFSYTLETGKANEMCLTETYSRVRVGKHLLTYFLLGMV